MSLIQRDRYRKKLDKLLSRAGDAEFIQMIWAVDALQSDRVAEAGHLLTFPPEAATTDITAKFKIHRWELETLVQQLLLTPKAKVHGGKNRVTDCSKFTTAATAVNFLRALEDAEAGIYLQRMHILKEMPRIGHREFPWQRGYLNPPQFYRHAFIYGQGECAAYFERTYGLTINQFSLVGFGLYATISKHAWLPHPYSLEAVGISPEVMSVAMRLLSRPLEQANAFTKKIVQQASQRNAAALPVAYQPSFLRQFPIIQFQQGCVRHFGI